MFSEGREMIEFDVDYIRLMFALDSCLRIYGKRDVAFTVQCHSALFEFGPYIQAQFLDDFIEVEITSNKYLNPTLTNLGMERMEALGWNAPDPDSENDHPNYWAEFPRTPEGLMQSAQLWVRTLKQVFDLPMNTRFNISPINRAILDEVSQYLVPVGLPMNFTLFDFRNAEWRKSIPPFRPNPYVNLNVPLNSEEAERKLYEDFDNELREIRSREKKVVTDTPKKRPKIVKVPPSGDRPSAIAKPKKATVPARKKRSSEGTPVDWANNISQVLRRALELNLQGTDIIRLASTMTDKQTVMQIRDLVYGVAWFKGLNFTAEQLMRLGIHPPDESSPS